MTCKNCKQKEGTIFAVLNDKFGNYCTDCYANQQRQASPGNAQYKRDRDREDHKKDLIQPRDAHGKPNREFIRNYPEHAKDNFTRKELEQYG